MHWIKKQPTTGYVLIVGNPIDGIHLLGPFVNHDAANKYGYEVLAEEWWITQVHSPIGVNDE